MNFSTFDNLFSNKDIREILLKTGYSLIPGIDHEYHVRFGEDDTRVVYNVYVGATSLTPDNEYSQIFGEERMRRFFFDKVLKPWAIESIIVRENKGTYRE